jgi:hypothetical protein
MGRLLRHQSVFPVLDSWEKLSASVLKETTKIERESQPFSEVLARVRDHLARLVGVEGDLGYELSDLSFDGLEQALVPFLRQEGCRPLPLRIQGSGVVSLQLFALILEFIQGREAKGLSSLLLIEEPELHLFPFNQRRLLEAVMTAPISESAPPDPSAPATPDVVAPSPDAGLQLIVTSHSPTVAEQFDLDSILILTKSLNDEVQAKALRPDEARPEKWFRREKTAIVSALMSRAVLVVEGQGEERMMNILGSSHLHPRGLAALGVGVLNGEGAQICNTAEWIAETGTNVITLVDGDANGCQYAEDLRRRQISFLSWPPSWKLGHAVLHNATEPLRRKLWDEARRAASKRHQMPEDPRDIPAAFDELIKAQAAADAVAWRLIEEPWLPPAFGALFDTLNAKLRDAQSQERVPFFGETLTVPGV